MSSAQIASFESEATKPAKTKRPRLFRNTGVMSKLRQLPQLVVVVVLLTSVLTAPRTVDASSGTVEDAVSLDEILNAVDYDPVRDAAVLRLYQAFFGRDPEPAGARYWLGLARAGTSLTEIADAFTLQPEFETNYGGTDNRTYLTRVYTNVLGRDFDQGGFNYWLDTLEGTNISGGNRGLTRISRGELVRWVSASSEFVLQYPYRPAPLPQTPKAPATKTLARVLDRGVLNCGVSGSAFGFSLVEPDGSMGGLDADYCRAVAAAVFGDATKVNFVQLSAAERFPSLFAGEVDVVMRNTTWTQSRDTHVGVDFGPTTFHDGLQLMGRANDGFAPTAAFAALEGATVCVTGLTTTETTIARLAAEENINLDLTSFESFSLAMSAFRAGTCDVVSTDGSGLLGWKAALPEGDEWTIFPSTPLTSEPMGPVYGQNDSQWADIIDWTVYATISAERNGVTSANAATQLVVGMPETVRLLGGDGQVQTSMGLSADAFLNVIQQVGNYDEIFTRNIEPLGITRAGSPNASVVAGGLIFAPPAR